MGENRRFATANQITFHSYFLAQQRTQGTSQRVLALLGHQGIEMGQGILRWWIVEAFVGKKRLAQNKVLFPSKHFFPLENAHVFLPYSLYTYFPPADGRSAFKYISGGKHIYALHWSFLVDMPSTCFLSRSYTWRTQRQRLLRLRMTEILAQELFYYPHK